MQAVYRGTQRREIKGARTGQSWAFSLPVAVIWSAVPGDPWAHSKEVRRAHFISTSTIHIGQADVRNALNLGGIYTSLAEVLRKLEWGSPEGITDEEVLRVFNYMHNRLIGKAKGGEFVYQVLDEYGDPRDESEIPLSFLMPMTLISEARDEWDAAYDRAEAMELAARVVADTFIFADAPRVQMAAKRLGYDALTYHDVFQGGESAAEELLGRDVEDLEGIEQDYDLEDNWVPIHDTLRPLGDDVITDVVAVPTEEVLADMEEWRAVATMGAWWW